MEGNPTELTVPAQLRRRAEERPDDIAHRLVDVDDATVGRWDRESTAASPARRPCSSRTAGPALVWSTRAATSPSSTASRTWSTRAVLNVSTLDVEATMAEYPRVVEAAALDAGSRRGFAGRVSAAPAREAAGHAP